MVNEEAFRRLTHRIMAGGEDAQKAAYELMEEYWQELTGFARRKLCASRLRSRASPSDIFESVRVDFIDKATRGRISLVDRNEVKNLLFTMFRNRLVREHREKYGRRWKPNTKVQGLFEYLDKLAGSGSDSNQITLGKEHLQTLQDLLDPRSREVLEFRSDGLDWPEIGNRLGANPVDLQMGLRDTVQRLRTELDRVPTRSSTDGKPEGGPKRSVSKHEKVVADQDYLHVFLARLSAQERNLFVLHDVDGKTWPEIGQLLGENHETLQKQLDRAKKRIKQELGGDEVNYD